MTTLATRLRAAMAGPPRITQAALARAVKVSQPTVNDWLSGKSQTIRGPILILVAKKLGVSPDWLALGKGGRAATDAPQSQPTGIDTRILTQAAQRICSRFAEDSMVFDVESEDDVALLVAVYMDEMAKEMPETTEATIVHFQRIRKIKGNAGDAYRTSVKAPKAS